MSSEVYMRWTAEQRHKELIQQLARERQRQKEIFRKMTEDITNIRQCVEGAKSVSANKDRVRDMESMHFSNIYNNMTEDVKASGFDEKVIDGLEVQTQCVNSGGTINAIDWSEQLKAIESVETNESKKIDYAHSISLQVDAVVPNTNENALVKNDFVSFLNNLLQDKELDFDYFKTLIDGKKEQLILNIRDMQPKLEQDLLFEYHALCTLMEIEPRRLTVVELNVEVEKLRAQYLEKNEEEYVFENLKEVFAELNMAIESEMELEGLQGQCVCANDIENCSVFVGGDGQGIIFETIAEIEEGTMSTDKRAKIEEEASKICEKHLEIIKRMKQRGIVLETECEVPPKVEHLQKVQMTSAQRQRRKKSKELYLGG